MSGMPIGEMIGAGGQTMNNRMQQVIDIYQFFKSVGDQQRMQAAIKQFRNIPNLDPKDLQYAAQTMGIQPDVLSGNQRTDQVNALRQLQDVASNHGLDNSAIAGNQQSGMLAARQNKSDNAAISDKLQRQGMAPGSGAELGMRQQASQAGYNTLAMTGAQNAANAQMRALQAIQASGRLSGDIASAQQGRDTQNRRAKMERDRYNSGVRNAASQFNSGQNLNAAQYNTNLARNKIDPANGATTELRTEQTGYARDFGNREQLQGEQLGNMFGSFGGGKK